LLQVVARNKGTEERVVVTDSETVEKREVKKTTQNTDADYDATSSGRAR
jgi:hypothetical protein